jgi:hypothetical protein
MTIIQNIREGAMTNKMATMQTPGNVRLNTGPLIFGAELIGVGGVLLMAGFAVGGMTMMSTARRWIGDQEMPPSEIVRHHWRKTKAATVAGASAWQNATADS